MTSHALDTMNEKHTMPERSFDKTLIGGTMSVAM